MAIGSRRRSIESATVTWRPSRCPGPSNRPQQRRCLACRRPKRLWHEEIEFAFRWRLLPTARRLLNCPKPHLTTPRILRAGASHAQCESVAALADVCFVAATTSTMCATREQDQAVAASQARSVAVWTKFDVVCAETAADAQPKHASFVHSVVTRTRSTERSTC
jgi:hypothetical protein